MKQILKHKASYNSTMWTIVCIWFKYYVATANHPELSIWDEFSLFELYPLESVLLVANALRFLSWNVYCESILLSMPFQGWQLFCLSTQDRIPMSSGFCCYSWDISCQLKENYFYSSLLVLELLRFLSLTCSSTLTCQV